MFIPLRRSRPSLCHALVEVPQVRSREAIITVVLRHEIMRNFGAEYLTDTDGNPDKARMGQRKGGVDP